MKVQVLGEDHIDTFIRQKQTSFARNSFFAPRAARNAPTASVKSKKSFLTQVSNINPTPTAQTYGGAYIPNPIKRADAIAQTYDSGMLGGEFWDSLASFGNKVSNVVSSDSGKTITGAVISTVTSKMTPTQKAQVQTIQNAAGIPSYPISATSQSLLTLPPQPSTLDKSLPYIIVGGAVLIAAVIMFSTKK